MAAQMTARETEMIEYAGTYRNEAMLAHVALACTSGDCECDAPHSGDEIAEANTHALLASAAAAMFQGLAALEAASRSTR